MKPTELRIGNKINRCGDEVTVSWGTIQAACYGSDIGKGIHLTEELVVKMGFKIFSSSSTMGYSITGYSLNGFMISYNKHEGMGYKTDGENYFEYNRVKIKYVHQLQNLYFDITGEELTIN